MDRFGLRVHVRGLNDTEERAEVYRRARAYRYNPARFIREWEAATIEAEDEIINARSLLKETLIPDKILNMGLELVLRLKIDSHRAEYTLFEAARAYAAADSRTEVTITDLETVAPLALRQRNSEFMNNFFDNQIEQDETINTLLQEITQE
jgi:magnesium chelatase subunit I